MNATVAWWAEVHSCMSFGRSPWCRSSTSVSACQPRTLSAMVWPVDHCRGPPHDKFLLCPAWRFLANAVLGAALPTTHSNGGQATHGDGVCDRELAKHLSGSTNVLEHALSCPTDSRRHASDEFCPALACAVRFTAGMLSCEPAGEKLAPSLTPLTRSCVGRMHLGFIGAFFIRVWSGISLLTSTC